MIYGKFNVENDKQVDRSNYLILILLQVEGLYMFPEMILN